MFRCSENGRDYGDVSHGIVDDGEFISWDWINGQLSLEELRSQFPLVDTGVLAIFDSIVEAARDYHFQTGRYLQIWGELAELFVEAHFGLKRHKPCAQGSDGKIGNDFVEVKAISPEKHSSKVAVSVQGNFNKLVVVKINADFGFEARMIDRRSLRKNPSKLHARWEDLPPGASNVSD